MTTDFGADRDAHANYRFLVNDFSEYLHSAAVGRRGDWLTGSINPGDNSLTLAVGNHELVVRQHYEVLSIANDIFIALWFIVGSALFFSPSTSTADPPDPTHPPGAHRVKGAGRNGKELLTVMGFENRRVPPRLQSIDANVGEPTVAPGSAGS